jgi:PKD repeat protein
MKLHTLLSLATVAAAILLPTAVHAADPANPAARRAHPAKPAFPQMTLRENRSQGQRAIELLGDRLPEVAAWYGKSPDELRALLLADRLLRVDGRGRLFVEDELEAPLPASTPAEDSVLSGNLLPLDQTFLLHSRPGARRTIYLNFKGATLQGTAWNGSTSSITALPYDVDGLPYSFSTAELQRIQGIWQRVAEDFAPFDVNVTTEEPPADVLLRSSSTDQVFGTTVLITNNNGVYSCSCGGVAYLSVFDDTGSYYKPALVFYNQLGGGNEKYVAEAISHEAGHNMGLQHDGYSGGAYYSGHGSGTTSWAPIMGVGYSRNLVQWSKGEYATATSAQDDYGVMESNGLPIRLDDYGDTLGSATLLAGTSSGGVSSYATQGVIERPTDVDQFAFVAAAGTVTVNLSPAFRSPNLDALIELRNGAGTLLASANPTEALNASLSVNLPQAGTYYVAVRGTGKGDPLSTGYTAYGSLGNYLLSISALTASGQPPVAAVSATPVSGTVPLNVNFSATGSSDADGSIVAYDWTFGDGSSASGATVSHTYGTAGSFTATLKVTDNSGLSATKSTTITVNPQVVIVPMRVADIGMSLTVNKNGQARANAAVQVVDNQGRPVPGATVAGRWSGLTTAVVSGITGSTGAVTFPSGTTRNRGTFTFTVTGVTSNGYQYDATLNTETADSITR